MQNQLLVPNNGETNQTSLDLSSKVEQGKGVTDFLEFEDLNMCICGQTHIQVSSLLNVYEFNFCFYSVGFQLLRERRIAIGCDRKREKKKFRPILWKQHWRAASKLPLASNTRKGPL